MTAASLSGCIAVVLGATAIEQLDPTRAHATLSRLRRRVVLSFGACTGTALVPWVTLGFREVVPPTELVERLRSLAFRPARPLVATARWLPRCPEPGSDAAVATAMVHHLGRIDVNAWSDALRWPRRRLLGVCKATFNVAPKRLLLRYLVIAFHQLRESGASLEECSEVLGYSDPRSLRRAVRLAFALSSTFSVP